MENEWTLERIQSFIDNKTEESNTLDYKAADALAKTDGKRNELSKDVSAFANSNGGVIIYGVKEHDNPSQKHLPEKIDPIDRTIISKEWIDQVITTKIQPKIEGITITPITVNDEINHVIYVVEIPKSNTAHQASGHKYYKRYNFQSEPMEDYEIRDVMNRGQHPIIDLEFEIEELSYVKELLTNTLFGATENKVEIIKDIKLKVYARNNGNIFANYVNYYIELNRNIMVETEYENLRKYKKDNSGAVYAEFYGENTIRDVLDVEYKHGFLGGSNVKYGPSRFDPILPKMHSRPEKIKLIESYELFKEEFIEWKVYADNAKPRNGKIRIGDIKIKQIVNQ
jgi:hypothetical protein